MSKSRTGRLPRSPAVSFTRSPAPGPRPPGTRRSAAPRGAAVPLTLEARLRACFDSLPGSERSVADLLLAHPARLVTHTATELAAEGASSKAAVTRLIHRLGYAGYAAARAEAREAQQWGSPVYLEAPGPAGSVHQHGISAHLAADQQLLARTLGGLSDADLSATVAALADARRVVVVGFRNSAWLAMYARSQIGLLRPGVELAPMPTETLAEALAGLGPQDVVLALGLRRRVPAFAAALRAAKAEGARMALLTDPTGAADLRMADWTLTCHCQGAAMFDSYVAAVSILNYLAARLAQALGDGGRQRLLSVEQWHARLGDLA
jgi:DNA-binding MurR/RpiR family transcriptional regulator